MCNLQVNHKSEIKSDNRLCNLEWVTAKENSNYGSRIERVASHFRIPVICLDTGTVYESVTHAAASTNTKTANVSRVCKNRRGYKTAGGLRWAYLYTQKEVVE
jgi:hypothetical protein